MSNHSGSYLLNEALEILHRYGVFDLLGRDKSQQMVVELVRRACHQYDCNASEILEDREVLFGICCGCLSTERELRGGWCEKCDT